MRHEIKKSNDKAKKKKKIEKKNFKNKNQTKFKKIIYIYIKKN